MQDRAIVQIGKIALKEMGNKEPYELFIQNMFPNKENYKMIVAVFEMNEKGERVSCSFRNIDADIVNRSNYRKYAYRKGTARGGDITFTTKFGDIEKKFRTLVQNQLKNLVATLSSSSFSKDYHVFYAIYQFLNQEANYEEVKKELAHFYNGLSKEEKMATGLSLKFLIDGQEKYLVDFESIQNILNASGTEEKSEKYGVKSEGTDSLCSICLRKQQKLHGFASPFKYATVDKPGMVSGFFKQSNNWKNYPICSECSLQFELGRAFITQNLNNYFYGKAYYAIPKTILSKDEKNLQKAITRLRELYDDFSSGGQKVETKEDHLQKMISQEEDYFNLNLLFYEENPTTKAIKIKLLLEEIFPSRFRKLFVDTPNEVNAHPLYQKAITEKKESKDLKFSFGILKTFFEADFYDLIQKVFLLQKFSKETLFLKFMSVIRTNYNRKQSAIGYVEPSYVSVLKAHLVLYYLQNLELLDYNKNFQFMSEEKKSGNKSGFDTDKIKSFMSENKGLLDSNARVGVFLLGAFVKHVLNVQYRELSGGTPFEKKLKGYSLSPADLQTIYTEAFAKLKQYDSLPVTLMDLLSEFFVLNFPEIQKMSNNEASFYLVAGMQFSDKLKFPKQNSNQP